MLGGFCTQIINLKLDEYTGADLVKTRYEIAKPINANKRTINFRRSIAPYRSIESNGELSVFSTTESVYAYCGAWPLEDVPLTEGLLEIDM